ncbi:MAG: hypothetical protein KKA31_00835 [Candidatus Margulisbacteria bacterium]|nr:hypothetical protein [Candidatus Margulisiibacteriota bacterium]
MISLLSSNVIYGAPGSLDALKEAFGKKADELQAEAEKIINARFTNIINRASQLGVDHNQLAYEFISLKTDFVNLFTDKPLTENYSFKKRDSLNVKDFTEKVKKMKSILVKLLKLKFKNFKEAIQNCKSNQDFKKLLGTMKTFAAAFKGILLKPRKISVPAPSLAPVQGSKLQEDNDKICKQIFDLYPGSTGPKVDNLIDENKYLAELAQMRTDLIQLAKNLKIKLTQPTYDNMSMEQIIEEKEQKYANLISYRQAKEIIEAIDAEKISGEKLNLMNKHLDKIIADIGNIKKESFQKELASDLNFALFSLQLKPEDVALAKKIFEKLNTAGEIFANAKRSLKVAILRATVQIKTETIAISVTQDGLSSHVIEASGLPAGEKYTAKCTPNLYFDIEKVERANENQLAIYFKVETPSEGKEINVGISIDGIKIGDIKVKVEETVEVIDVKPAQF